MIKHAVPWCYEMFGSDFIGQISKLKSPKELLVKKIENSFANNWVLRHHYLKRKIYIARNVCYGAFASDFCVGVVMFGYPVWTTYKGIVPPNLPGEVPELLRLSTVLGLPRNSESYFCSRAMRMMKMDWKEESGFVPKAITSLCDLSQGFNGALYKALNFREHNRGEIGRAPNPGGAHGKWNKNNDKTKPEKIMFVLDL